jgi:hypothetical protein
MPSALARWTTLAITVLTVAACGDAPLIPSLSPAAPNLSAVSGRHLAETPYACAMLRRSPTDGTWSNRQLSIYYPQPELGGGRTVSYRLRGTTPSGGVVAAAFCTVPYTEAALRRVDRRLGVERGGGADQYAAREGGITTQGCVIEGMCVLEPIVVIAPIAPNGDPDDVCSRYPDECSSGGGGGDGGNGGEYPTP